MKEVSNSQGRRALPRSTNRDATLRRIDHWLLIGAPSDALLAVESLYQEDQEHLPTLERLARVYWRLGRWSDALTATERLLLLNPLEPGYRYLQGNCLQGLGRYGEAVEAYSRCASAENQSLREEAARASAEVESWQRDALDAACAASPELAAEFARSPESVAARFGYKFRSTTAGPRLEGERRDRVRPAQRPS